ncbi:patatin-like phospholipase domain-containing protein 4 isoform X1 [Gadus chalcogrammus]|uniref:patatin-like phospholipase domain-containing protein 4 isoform X1 n=1 Tax=Gadus chalcogrammus TaxID=1042646 RepID=UPI0024C47621|nr:patatin-like phospholipase domain-containing protein 4 isoform X1 [Gadus chalcogrammus]
MAALNVSFAACGFMGIYQLGAVGALLRHGDRLVASLRACAGASAGALVAAVLITAPDKVEHCKDFTYKFAAEVRSQKLGALTPGYDFMLALRSGMEDVLPGDAHKVAADRLWVSVTHAKSGKNSLVGEFSSRDELIMALLASSFVPVYAGLRTLEFRGQKYYDGGFSDGLPLLPSGRTLTVSPFAGQGVNVCPAHTGRSQRHFRHANMNILLSLDNIVRLNQALFPPPLARMRSLCQQGEEDTLRFLKKEGWLY